jgi:hypothetical protein
VVEEDLAGHEDGLEAVVVACAVVTLHVAEEGGGVLEELVVEGVLGDGRGEVEPFAEGGGVAVLEGELLEALGVFDPVGVALADDAAHAAGGHELVIVWGEVLGCELAAPVRIVTRYVLGYSCPTIANLSIWAKW